jgi:hypothetical protein
VSGDPRDERISELEKENADLRRQVQELARRLKELEEKQRRDKKQAARFARRKHVPKRRKPGRAAGHPGAYQGVPDHVDEEVYAPLSECPDCHGEVADVEVVEQFVVDLPEVKPHVTRVVTERGYCACCKRSVRSTHPRQVSQAVGAAKVSLGWRQQCLGHFLHRASELEEDLTGRAVCFPRDVKALLHEAVEVSRKKDQLAPATLQHHADRLESRLDELLARQLSHPENRRLSQHLLNHYDELFPCITEPGVPSTNNLAEQELRPAVVVRKIGGCNRSEAHASAHAIIASVAQTAHRRDATLTDFVTRWLQPTAGPFLRSLQDALFANVRLFAGAPTPALR